MVAVDGVLVGLLALSDPLRPEAKSLLLALNARGIGCAIVSGDNQRTVAVIAAELGVAKVGCLFVYIGLAQSTSFISSSSYH